MRFLCTSSALLTLLVLFFKMKWLTLQTAEQTVLYLYIMDQIDAV